MFEYTNRNVGGENYQGRTKSTANFVVDHFASIPWGDPVVSGEEVEKTGIFRIISHNVNGLSTADQQADVLHFANAISDKAVALFGIQETNRNFERIKLIKSFHKIINQVSTHHHGAVASAKMHWPQDYQPGGTAVSVRNKWATRFLDKGSDDFGRWSWITLAGQGTTKITFISAYRVCDGASEAAITSRTVRSQQEWMYADRGYESINLRKQFVTDLIEQLKKWQVEGNDIVLMMDANEQSKHGSAVDRFIYACGLTDVHIRETEANEPPPTYHRGSYKIDFVLVSPRVASAVKSRTVLPIHDGYLSDHRALLVDFDACKLFSGSTSEVVPPSTRQLTSSNPKAVSKYMKSMLQQMETHCIWQKVSDLQLTSLRGQWTNADSEKWETFDRLLAQARIFSESKCNTKRSGQKPWSPELKLTGETLLYWKLRYREFTSRKVNQAMLDYLAIACKIAAADTTWMLCTQVKLKVKEARKKHKAVKLNASELRDNYMTEQAHFFAALHGMSDDSAKAAIAAREKSSHQFRTLRSIFQKGRANGLERLDVPHEFAVLRQDEPQPRIQLVTKEEIEDVLLPHTVRRFRQHSETPFGHGKRSAELGHDCSSEDFESILNGTYDRDLEQLTEEAKEWIRQLKRRKCVAEGNQISTSISTEDWINGWMKMRESTASAPGGHYGHYKTAAIVARLPEDHPDHTRVLAEVYAVMLSLPLLHGFAPVRWQYCVDAILEKTPGKPIIEKLRIIMLYEADFNYVLKLIWGRRLVRHAEKYRWLGSSNHGSRSGRQTIDALLEKLLLYEYARLTRTSLITVDNDAKSCYDRIIKSLAMIACVAVGLPLMAAKMHNKTHHGMVHAIKTRHGTLRPYSSTNDNPLEGTGQGSGASPAIWLLYSISLLNAYRNFTTGMQVSSPFETMLVTILAIFYVDDGMPGVNDALEDVAAPLLELLKHAEDATQSWERLLYGSGGALELSKCFAYVLYWDLSNGQHRLIRPHEIPDCTAGVDDFRGPIGLTYGDQTDRNLLATEDPWVGRRTLGVRIAPAGNWTDEYEHRRSQARELALQIAGSNMSRDTARVGYFMMVCPKLEYPLAVTQFTQTQCDSITSPVLRACMSQMGYNCNSPKEVVYGPTVLFGMGFHDYYIEQGIRQISTMFGHIRQNSETGKLIQIELQWCQVQAGTAKNILAEPEDALDYIETCWIMSIRDFLRTYNLSIDMTKCTIPAGQSFHDEFIMDAVRCRGNCTATELQRINACRLYLQVARLSDITSANGKYLRLPVLKGQKHDEFRSTLKWPRQGRPPLQWWRLWSKTVRGIFTVDGTSQTLRIPLGQWHDGVIPQEWNTTCAVFTGRIELYERRSDGMYNVFHNNNSAAGRQYYVDSQSIGMVDSIPCQAVPATVGNRRKDGRRSVSFRHRKITTVAQEEGTGIFEDYATSKSAHVRQTLAHADLTEVAAQRVADQLYNHRRIAAGTDGGLLNGKGTFGYVWADPDNREILSSGGGQVQGQPVSMSSTRTELCGLFAAFTYIRLIMEYYHIVLPKEGIQVTIYCDSKAALQRVQDLYFNEFGTTWRCRANYDLEAAIRGCIQQQSSLKIQWTWVKGHARRRKKPENFSVAETLNEAADELATAARTHQAVSDDSHWPEQHISLKGPSGRVSGRLVHEIRFCCTAPDLESYWQQRYGWSKQTAGLIDLLGTVGASRGMPSEKARRIQKLRCGWLPVNHRESRSDPDRQPGCSACSPSNLTPETVDHVFQCTATQRRRAILDRFTSFQAHFTGMKTPAPIIRALQTGAIAWIEGRQCPDVGVLMLPDNELGQLVARAYQEQTELGWNVLFRGFWTNTWRTAQEKAYTTIRNRTVHDTSERWATKAQLWFYALFEHIWGLRNADEHGVDNDTQRVIRLSKCERAIRRLYDKGEELPYAERHPFRSAIEDILAESVVNQELWISKTGEYLVRAATRFRERLLGQAAITSYFSFQE